MQAGRGCCLALPHSPGAGFEDTLRHKQGLFGPEPTGASPEQAPLCVPGCTESAGTVGREPGSLTWHQVAPLRPWELEIQ